MQREQQGSHGRAGWVGFARDDKGRGVTQVGVVGGCRENNRSLPYAPVGMKIL